MGCSNVPRPVFVESNLGTRFALPVSPDMMAEEFKRDLERAHLNCFPEFGSLTVTALMVKQRSRCYHLSESLPLKHAFVGSNDAWFLEIDVNPWSISNHIESLKLNGTEVNNLASAANVATDSVGPPLEKTMKCRRKKVRIQQIPYLKAAVMKIPSFLLKRKKKRENVKRNRRPIRQPHTDRSKRWDSNGIAETHGITFSEPISVSGIIKKYFSDYDEVGSTPGFPFSTVPDRCKKRLNSIAEELREKHVRPEVGKRLVLVSGSLGLTPSNPRPELSLCRCDDGKSPSKRLAAIVRHLVFEMTDEDE